MPTSAPAPDREALMASQRRQVGSEDEASLEDEELGAERERLRTEKESGWTALR